MGRDDAGRNSVQSSMRARILALSLRIVNRHDYGGELTARAKLIIHGTGRVSGTIRYGKLIVAEGGILSGDVQRLEGTVDNTTTRTPMTEQTPLTSRPLR